MKKITTFFSLKVLPNLFLLLAVGLTTVVTSIAAYKLAQDMPVGTEESIVNSDEDTSGDDQSGDSEVDGNGNTLDSDEFDFPPALDNTGSTNGGVSNGVTANLCLVTIAGTQYNFFNLRNTHSGGNVFVCNTDMTATFQRKHGTNYSMISAYIYVPGSTTAPGPTTGSGGENEEDQEEDEFENEVEYEEDDD